ncbi:hypothetical protein ACFQ10_13780 [Streptomyces indonesiensis]
MRGADPGDDHAGLARPRSVDQVTVKAPGPDVPPQVVIVKAPAPAAAAAGTAVTMDVASMGVKGRPVKAVAAESVNVTSVMPMRQVAPEMVVWVPAAPVAGVSVAAVRVGAL